MTRCRVVLAGFYPPPFAGEPIHVKQLAQFLRDRGLSVDIVNLNRHAAPSHEYLHASGRWMIVRLLFAVPDRSSILHLHTNGHNWKSWLMISVGALAARLKGPKAILTIHSGLFPGYVATMGPVLRRLVRWVLRSFTKIIAVNREIGDAMDRFGLTARDVVVIPAFLGVAESTGLDAEDRRIVDGCRPIVVAVGGGDRDPEMGLPTVVETLPGLAERFPQLRAVFIGWRVGLKTQPLIEARRLTKHAVCVGEVSHDRCLRLIQGADVVVRSTFADGDAISVREALDFGVPVVASDTAFRPEGAILFRKGDARDLQAKLTEVLSGPGRGRKRPSAAGQPARDLWKIYCGVMDADSDRPPRSSPSGQGDRATVSPP